jgi:hypothetical protein
MRWSFSERIYAATVLLWELCRYGRAERPGTVGLWFHQFLLNELRDNRYLGHKKAIVEAFAIVVCIRRGDTKGCEMAFKLMGSDIPVEKLTLASLQKVRAIAESMEFLQVRDSVLAEMRRRNRAY